MRARKIKVLAAATLLGVTMAGMPVLAGDTNVTYISGAEEVGNGQLLMIVPSDLYLNQKKTEDTSKMRVRMTDGALDLPKDLEYTVSLSSKNGLKLKTTEKGLEDREGKYNITFGSKDTTADLKGLEAAGSQVEAFSVGDGNDLKGNVDKGADGTFVDAANGKGTSVTHDFTAEISEAEAKKLEGKSDVEYKDVVTFELTVNGGTGVTQ